MKENIINYLTDLLVHINDNVLLKAKFISWANTLRLPKEWEWFEEHALKFEEYANNLSELLNLKTPKTNINSILLYVYLNNDKNKLPDELKSIYEKVNNELTHKNR